MSFGVSAITWIAAAYAGYSIYSGEEQKRTQESANNQARDRAKKAEVSADQAFNKTNMKKPDVFGILAQNKAAGQNGVGSTNLTGALGVDPTLLTLGKNTLLGA
jgi:hypothetical protein